MAIVEDAGERHRLLRASRLNSTRACIFVNKSKYFRNAFKEGANSTITICRNINVDFGNITLQKGDWL